MRLSDSWNNTRVVHSTSVPRCGKDGQLLRRRPVSPRGGVASAGYCQGVTSLDWDSAKRHLRRAGEFKPGAAVADRLKAGGRTALDATAERSAQVMAAAQNAPRSGSLDSRRSERAEERPVGFAWGRAGLGSGGHPHPHKPGNAAATGCASVTATQRRHRRRSPPHRRRPTSNSQTRVGSHSPGRLQPRQPCHRRFWESLVFRRGPSQD